MQTHQFMKRRLVILTAPAARFVTILVQILVDGLWFKPTFLSRYDDTNQSQLDTFRTSISSLSAELLLW